MVFFLGDCREDPTHASGDLIKGFSVVAKKYMTLDGRRSVRITKINAGTFSDSRRLKRIEFTVSTRVMANPSKTRTMDMTEMRATHGRAGTVPSMLHAALTQTSGPG